MTTDPEEDYAIHQWRELGFYYDIEQDPVKWLFFGSKCGLRHFAELLKQYVSDPKNQEISEHEHYGPYRYLEVMTWHEAKIDGHAISGTLADIDRLAGIIESKLDGAKTGDRIVVRDEYSPNIEAVLELVVKDDNFDPSSLDPFVSRSKE